MRKLLMTLTGILVVGILTACSTPQSASTAVSYQKISAEQAKSRMDSGDAVIVVDVRTQEEYNESHIKGAVLIPNETITTENPEALPDKDAEILVYCRSGNRSAQAAQKLAEMGYTNIKDFGGITNWPYETVSEG